MSDDLIPCARCGNEKIGEGCRITPMLSECYCWCTECDAGSPAAPSQEEARAAWNSLQQEDSPIAERGEQGD